MRRLSGCDLYAADEIGPSGYPKGVAEHHWRQCGYTPLPTPLIGKRRIWVQDRYGYALVEPEYNFRKGEGIVVYARSTTNYPNGVFTHIATHKGCGQRWGMSFGASRKFIRMRRIARQLSDMGRYDRADRMYEAIGRFRNTFAPKH